MKNKKSLLSLALIFLLLLSSCLMCACVDYEYTYYFSVEGGNGTVSIFFDDKLYESDSSPLRLAGGRKGKQQFVFLATPFEGYRVKQWTCDGQIVQGNKTVIYMCGELNPNKAEVRVTVEFELIENIVSDVQSAYVDYVSSITSYNQPLQDEIDVAIYHSTNNAIFAKIDCDKPGYLKTVEVCLDKFFPSINGRFWVFSGNKIYSLYNALDENIISQSDFYDFTAKCSSAECKPCVRSFKHEIEISDDLQNEIIQKYWEKYCSEKSNIKFEELSVSCFGNFEKCQVIFVNGPFAYMTVMTYDAVGDVIFSYGSSHQLRAYKDGEFYSLAQAYAKGYISEEEALTIK